MDFSFPETEPREWKRLGSLLRSANYSTPTIRELMGVPNSPEEILSNSGRYSLYYLDELSKMQNSAAVLAALFMLSGRVALPDLDVLNPELLHVLWRLQLIERIPESPDIVRGVVSIIELRERYFLSDPLFENLGYEFKISHRPDSCMPPHASSLQLLDALRKPQNSRSFLDVGCGSGCQSIIFASDYEVIDGFDPSSRSVSFARINALLNGCRAAYTVNRWEEFEPKFPYEHIAFNAPDSPTAFSYVNEGLSKMLTNSGVAQISLALELTERDDDLASALGTHIKNEDKWRISVHENVRSPFSLPREHIAAGQLPEGSLTISHPDQKLSFFRDLTQRGIVEIVHVTLAIQHR